MIIASAKRQRELILNGTSMNMRRRHESSTKTVIHR